MNIAFATSEMTPFSKTGGLADVCGALPDELARLGHRVWVFTPYYRGVQKIDPKARRIAQGLAQVGHESVPWSLYQASDVAPALGGGAPVASGRSVCKTPQRACVMFIGNENYFNRDGLYGNAKGDYEDNCNRFVFFARACLAAAQSQALSIDVWHCHDWQSALIPVYLKLLYARHPLLGGAASLFTIHNLAYQGLFWHWSWPLLNLPWQHYNWKEFEFYGRISFMKAGLVFADALSTVSPTYAKEILTPHFGAGLDGVLNDRAGELHGILNGIDAAEWNPASDPLIPAAYDAEKLDGKAACKAALRQRFNLPPSDAPIAGLVGRLVEQKGFDLIAECLEELLARDLQVVILGTGNDEYEALIRAAREKHPDKLGVSFAFDNRLAHQIEAGSDFYLMPSRYEPCGLNQLYSLRYGTPPLVHRVGGLADTVEDAEIRAGAPGTEHADGVSGTGFVFDKYEPAAFLAALDRALTLYRTDPQRWRALQRNGMRQDNSWPVRAQAYAALYKEVAKRKKAAAAAGSAF